MEPSWDFFAFHLPISFFLALMFRIDNAVGFSDAMALVGLLGCIYME